MVTTMLALQHIQKTSERATKSKNNTRTTALELSVEKTTGGFKALLQQANCVTFLTFSLANRIFMYFRIKSSIGTQGEVG